MKNESTKVFSVRTEKELLAIFDEIIALKNENKNNVINELISEYVSNNVPVKEHITPIPIYENISRFGYDINRLDEKDAQLLIDYIIEENKPHYFEDDYLEFLYKTFLHTGIKYLFNELNIIIFHTYHFTESDDSFGKPTLDLYPSTMLYNIKTGQWKQIDDHDFIGINLNK